MGCSKSGSQSRFTQSIALSSSHDNVTTRYNSNAEYNSDGSFQGNFICCRTCIAVTLIASLAVFYLNDFLIHSLYCNSFVSPPVLITPNSLTLSPPCTAIEPCSFRNTLTIKLPTVLSASCSICAMKVPAPPLACISMSPEPISDPPWPYTI